MSVLKKTVNAVLVFTLLMSAALIAPARASADTASDTSWHNEYMSYVNRGSICELDWDDFMQVREDGHPAHRDSVMIDGHRHQVVKILKSYKTRTQIYRYLDRKNIDENCQIAGGDRYFYADYDSSSDRSSSADVVRS